MASSIVCSKAVVLLLFIHCLLLLPLFVGVDCKMLVMFCISFCPFKFWFHLAAEERERAWCFGVF